MPPTLVNVAFGALLAAALLGPAFDRRSVLVVLTAAALPDLDAVISVFVLGATNAVLHNVWIPVGAAALVYWDTTYRSESWLYDRYGWRGVRVAWVAVAAYAVAGIGVDLFNSESVNLFYPLHDQFYGFVGWLMISTHEGIVQTYVGLGGEGLLEIHRPGTTETYHVSSWVNPEPGTGTSLEAERRLQIVESGWQAVVVASAAAVLAIRFWEDA